MKKFQLGIENPFLFDDIEEDEVSCDFGEYYGPLVKNGAPPMQGKKRLKGSGGKLFKIPPPRPTDAHWVLPGEKIVFGNYKITAGFFYFGTNLPSEFNDSRNFVSLINPNISIPKKKNLDKKQDMKPNTIDYAELSGIQRRKYVLWHSGGRTDENIYAWFSILFLYGLERRVLVDSLRGIVKRDELVQIRNEAARIIALYGGKSAEIRRTYSTFLAYLEIECGDRKLYDIPFPYFECKTYRETDVFTAYINTALSQCMEYAVPVNAELAYGWYILLCDAGKNSPASTCGDVFKDLFVIRYGEMYGKGFLIKKNKTSVATAEEFCYKPECDSLQNTPASRLYYRAVVSDQKAYRYKLEEIALHCMDEIAPYLRMVKKSGSEAENIFLLPSALWSREDAAALRRFTEGLGEGMFFISLSQFKKVFFRTVPFSQTSFFGLVRALEVENIAIEPDVLSFPDRMTDVFLLHKLKNKIPKIRLDSDYFFSTEVIELSTSAYKLCVPQTEESFTWYYPINLKGYFHERLSAYVQLLMQYPLPLQQCIKRLTKFHPNDKKYITKHIQEEVLKDYNTSYEAISVIEKLYKGFGFSEKELYGDIHAGSATLPEKKKGTVKLDKNKIKQLRKDSDHVYNMLSGIFKDDDAAETAVINAEVKTDSKRAGSGYFNEAQTLFLKTILSRPEWRREELAEDAKRHSLMLDGFIEMVNEVAYNAFDDALIEGDEIITINTDIAVMMTERL
ncbi:MAG: TerB N-terminal domain-containing protein [Spirochaetaceae bacterium]|nr:TerB N-terminal domain-containing protein [Spirochaetaceae bacterium]